MANYEAAGPVKKKSNWDAWNEKVKAGTTTKSTSTATTKSVKSVQKQVKKGNYLIIALILFFIVGVVGGYFTYSAICRNDCFTIIGYADYSSEIVIGQDEELNEYVEQGAKCVSFGKDISDKVKITYKYREDLTYDAVEVSGVDKDVAGYYYVIYNVDDIKYGSVTLMKLVVVTREEL